jgi:DNA repair protein RecN (Recombination protein N)
MDSISKNHQVICVTHLPQIASKANGHLCVQKSVDAGRTVVSVQRLSDEERVQEVARMLGAAEDSKVALQHAREMLGMR